MASGSTSNIMASPAANASVYDIFLSFRGKDTRLDFSDHLYGKLTDAGIHTFRDKEGIRRTKEVKLEIDNAIIGAKGSVVVISENYATSTWCLDELDLILQQCTDRDHFVLPVYFKVEPSDVRNHRKKFAIKVKASTECTDENAIQGVKPPKWTVENVTRWKKALTNVGKVAGDVVVTSSTYQADIQKSIVDFVYETLDCKRFGLPKYLTGMATRYEEISSIINEPNVNFIVIWGMDGSGKTTLAKHIYNTYSNTFESLSFVEEIGGKQHGELLQVQEKLLCEVLGGKNRKIPSVSQGTHKIEEVLQKKKAFIVLDDITDHRQLADLLGSGEINAESKIIITTTVENITDSLNSGSRRCQKYKMKLLKEEESLELLCCHAFGSKYPKEGFQEVALRAVRYCDGNPLALEVLGSSLALNHDIELRESTLSSFENNVHKDIRDVLIRSYDSLPHDDNRRLFLHIACFFVGKYKEYVEKILERDCAAISGMKVLSDRCLLSVSPKNKLMMHRLLQELGKDIVVRESKVPRLRSRVWQSSDSYRILKRGEGSESLEGLALDMEEELSVQLSNLTTKSLNSMGQLKLLKLNNVDITGSYETTFSDDLKWLCWFGFQPTAIPSGLFLGNLVAIDMSNSKLNIFEPPTELKFLKIINFKDSHDLSEIRNVSRIPHLETLILWNCHRLVHVCETIKDLKSLALLHMTGCKNLFEKEQTKMLAGQEESTSSGEVAKQPTLSFPHSLHRLNLKGCNLDVTDSFPLSFRSQLSLQYLNLCNGLFEFLPDYNHLKNLRVLDLSLCSRLKSINCLPSTLAELYVYCCESLESISFESHQYTLQEFGYKGCTSLFKVEGLFKLVPIAKLEENDLGHMKWLKDYQNHNILLVGDVELTTDRDSCVQMLYEFIIMSTSLPDINGLNMMHDHVSSSSSLSFNVPLPPKNRRLKGLDVTFKYAESFIGDNDWAFFCKINTSNGAGLMYNPKVFGKPDSGKVGIWLSYWPIGTTLDVGDEVNVSIVVLSGLVVHECGVSLVYGDDEVAEETLENKMGWVVKHLQGDLSEFQLSTGAYYLCRPDFFELMEVGRLPKDWFRTLVGDTIDVIEVRGWRNTGRPKQLYRSFTELKTVKGIIHGPDLEEIYKIPEMSKPSFVQDEFFDFTSSMPEETMTSDTSSIFSDTMSISSDSSSRFSDTFSITSGSSSSIMASTSADPSMRYDVFLSFRGEDTRHSFTNHLYASLALARIYAYRDRAELIKGETLAPAIERAIKESRGSIVVLSEHYATSPWCLNELVSILEQRREGNHFVLPVFYNIDPSDVRKQRNSFAIKVKAGSSTWTVDNVNLWKEALTEIGSMTGLVLDGSRPETEIIRKIVEYITDKLDHRKLHLPYNLTGMAIRYEDIISFMNEPDVDFLVICGMFGSGKTTLAKYIYNSNYSSSFERRSYLGEIGRDQYDKHDALLQLQEKLLDDISWGENRKIPSVSEGTKEIEEALQARRALIVLDDIRDYNQLVSLVGTGKNNNAGSKIIITTRVLNVEEWFKSGSLWGYKKYEMRLLDDEESLELLRHHAFNYKRRIEDLEGLEVKAVSYCAGNPLALQVLGCSLSEDNSIQFWESTLSSFEKPGHAKIQDKLIQSYNSLPLDSNKQLFLQIACSFVGQDKDYVEKLLEHDYSASSGIRILSSRGLLSISSNRKLMMHPLIQQTGRKIARQTSEDP